MNNKGQTLVIFIILLPVFLAFCALVIDLGLATYENTKLKNTTKSILNSVIKNDKVSVENITRLYQKNDINIENLKININEKNIEIKNQYYIESMFGKILKIEEYEVRIDAEIDIQTQKIKFE